jgi:hypothetical protein
MGREEGGGGMGEEGGSHPVLSGDEESEEHRALGAKGVWRLSESSKGRFFNCPHVS